MVPLAVAGIAVATALVGTGTFTGWVPEHWTTTSMVLGPCRPNVFLSRLTVAGNLRHYHLTQVLQVGTMALWGGLVAFMDDMTHLVLALKGSLVARSWRCSSTETTFGNRRPTPIPRAPR